MVNSINPSDHTAGPISSSQSPQERQKLFEIQFETAVISAFVSVSGQNGSTKQQLSKIKNGIISGQSPDQLAGQLNQLIGQVNNGIGAGKGQFPPFSFSTEGSQTQALQNFAHSLETLVATATEKGSLPKKNGEKILRELSDFGKTVGQTTQDQAFEKLNGVIGEANKELPLQLQLPLVPLAHRR